MTSSSEHVAAKFAGPALVLGLGGAVTAGASLWLDWAVASTAWIAQPRESGWEWMAYGDVLLLASCLVIAVSIVLICTRPRVHAVALGIGAILLVVCAAAGALVVAALTSMARIDPGFVEHGAGPGPAVAIAGLLTAAVGVVVAMLGAASHDRPPFGSLHLPHPFQHSH